MSISAKDSFDLMSSIALCYISYSIIRIPTLLVTKNLRPFQEPRSIFPRPCHQSAMFKYRDRQQLLTISSMIAASILEYYMFISVTWKKLFENVCVKIQPSVSPKMDFYRPFQSIPVQVRMWGRELRLPLLLISIIDSLSCSGIHLFHTTSANCETSPHLCSMHCCFWRTPCAVSTGIARNSSCEPQT